MVQDARDFIRPHAIASEDAIVEGEQFRVTFPCECGFAIASNGRITILGEFEGQVLKFICPHANEVSMMMDDPVGG